MHNGASRAGGPTHRAADDGAPRIAPPGTHAIPERTLPRTRRTLTTSHAMEKRQERTLVAFRNVLVFVDQNPITPEPPLLTGMKRSLEGSMQKITELGIEQGTAMMFRVTHVERDRKLLRRERLLPLVRIARPILRYAPGVENVLRVPHARADAITVAEAAIEMAKVLKPHRKLLVSAGMAPDFLAQLQHEARQLALAAKHTAAARQKQARATAALAKEFKKAMETVTVIEGIIMLHFARDSATLKLWRNRRRVSARIGRPPQRTPRNRQEAIATPPPSTPEVTLPA